MDFEAQDATKLIILMIVGAAFAAAGLWLLLRPKTGGSSAKIELFGLKFESSSAGLLVFLIGAVFLVIPLFVPEKTMSSGRGSAGSASPTAASASETPKPAAGSAALILPSEAQVNEVEPNDRSRAANQVALGQIVAGDVGKGEEDWFVFALPETTPRYVEFGLRRVDGGQVSASIYNSREEPIGSVSSTDGVQYTRVEVSGNDRFYAKVVYYNYSPVSYELSLQAGPDN